jgi:hypothetical protein
MITINIKIDWLDKVNGLTVAEAIDYLLTLPQTHKLTAYPDGCDLHGVEQYSGLYYEREETPTELKQARIKQINKKIKDCESAIKYREKEIKAGYNIEHHTLWVGKSRAQLESLTVELDNLTRGKA